MLPRIALAALAAAAIAPGAAPAANHRAPTGGYSIELRGHVPVICRASLRDALVTPQRGHARLGAMNEFCNNPNGYEIYADHSPELAGAVLVVDGVEMKLARQGGTRIARSDRAAARSRSLELRLPEGANAGSISFRIVAL